MTTQEYTQKYENTINTKEKYKRKKYWKPLDPGYHFPQILRQICSHNNLDTATPTPPVKYGVLSLMNLDTQLNIFNISALNFYNFNGCLFKMIHFVFCFSDIGQVELLQLTQVRKWRVLQKAKSSFSKRKYKGSLINRLKKASFTCLWINEVKRHICSRFATSKTVHKLLKHFEQANLISKIIIYNY